MATTFAIGDLLTARLNFEHAGHPDQAINVLHYAVTSLSGAPADIFDALANCAEDLHDHFFDAWSIAASQDVAFGSVTVSNVFPLPRSVAVTHEAIGAVNGLVVAPSLPMQNAPTILKRTALGGRKGYGRLFYAGFPSINQTGGLINIEKVADLNDMVEAVALPVTVTGTGWSATLTPVLLNGPEDNPTTLTTIKEGQLASRVIRSQRRRQPGKGS